MRKPSCCTRRIIRTGTSTCRARSGTCRSCPRRPSTIFSAAPRRGCSSCRRATRHSARTSGSSAISWLDAVPLDANAAVEELRPHPEERALARVSKDGCTAQTRCHPSRRPLRGLLRMRSKLFYVIAIAGKRVDDGDLLDREVGDDLNRILVHDQHFLDAHAVAEALAVLGLQREGHAFLDLDRMVERPDARNDRLVVLGKPQPVPPQVRGGLILVLVAPGLHGGWPLLR